MLADAYNQLRKAQGLTNHDVSRLSGVNLSTIEKISSGSTENPTFQVVVAIAKVLDTPLDYFTDQYAFRSIREAELDHMRKYRCLDSSRKQYVDAYMNEVYDDWVVTLQERAKKMSHQHLVDKLFSTPFDKLAPIIDLLEHL